MQDKILFLVTCVPHSSKELFHCFNYLVSSVNLCRSTIHFFQSYQQTKRTKMDIFYSKQDTVFYVLYATFSRNTHCFNHSFIDFFTQPQHEHNPFSSSSLSNQNIQNRGALCKTISDCLYPACHMLSRNV